jgi:hypothetical protein
VKGGTAMPYVVTKIVYPNEKATEVAEKYFEALRKYPPDENVGVELVPAAVKSSHEGINVLNVAEVKQGKLEDALKRTTNMMVMFQSIPGFRYSAQVYQKVEEALATIGMSLPG